MSTATLAMEPLRQPPAGRPADRRGGWPLLLSVLTHALLLLPPLLLHSGPPPPPPDIVVRMVVLPALPPPAPSVPAPQPAPVPAALPQAIPPLPAARPKRAAAVPRTVPAAAVAVPSAQSRPVPAAPAAAAVSTAPAAAVAAVAAAAGPPPADYIAEIRARLEAAKVYPAEARRRGREGTVLLRFTLDRSGRLLDWAIAAGSGEAALDEAAGDMAVRAAPFPSFPADFTRSHLAMVVPVHFSLKPPHSGG